MPKTKKSTKAVSKKTKSPRKVAVTTKAPHMTKTIFGASYLLILAVLSLILITVSNQLLR